MRTSPIAKKSTALNTRIGKRFNFRALLLNLLALAACLMFLFPIYWMFIASIKTEMEIFRSPPTFFPQELHFDTYINQFANEQYNIYRAFLNSLIIATGTMVISTVLSIPAAYGLARYKLHGMRLFILLFLITQMLPASLILTPLFIIFQKIGAINTYIAPILADATIAIPFAVLILRTYFLTLPKELEDSAKIDGCNLMTTFVRIMLPLAAPGVVVASVFSFLFAWGDLAYSLTFINSPELRPMTAGIYHFLGYLGVSWNSLMAFGVVTILPVLLIFIFVQKYIISGLTNGAIKG